MPTLLAYLHCFFPRHFKQKIVLLNTCFQQITGLRNLAKVVSLKVHLVESLIRSYFSQISVSCFPQFRQITVHSCSLRAHKIQKHNQVLLNIVLLAVRLYLEDAIKDVQNGCKLKAKKPTTKKHLLVLHCKNKETCSGKRNKEHHFGSNNA